MLGFINRSLECFLRDTYGAPLWEQVARKADLGFDQFEPMQHYDITVTEAVITAAIAVLARPRDSILEDLGIFLVANSKLEPLRRLLRFGGVDFVEFLLSLDDLPERARLALPELEVPRLTLSDQGEGIFRLGCQMPITGIGHVIVGLLRAMADDYGALVLIDFDTLMPDGTEVVAIHLLDQRYSKGRKFNLAASMAG